MAELSARLIRTRGFETIVTASILVGAILVGLESYPSVAGRWGILLNLVDGIIVTVFTLEIVVRLFAAPRGEFFRTPWNVFDLILVILSLLPPTSALVGVVRLVRLLRILRLVRTMPKLRLLITTTMNSVPSIASISVLLALLFYVYAVAGVFLFGENDPIHFRDLQTSLVSLFRVITLEDWTDIMYTQIYGCDQYGYDAGDALCSDPYAFGFFGALFFMTFVFIGTWVVLNLFIGIILTGMDEARREVEETDGGGPTFDPGALFGDLGPLPGSGSAEAATNGIGQGLAIGVQRSPTDAELAAIEARLAELTVEIRRLRTPEESATQR